jgi:putative Mn2+ efflux pump MntP
MELARWTTMDYLTLILLSLGLSFDDFAGKIVVAFSISTALLPLLGWLVGLVIYVWIASL